MSECIHLRPDHLREILVTAVDSLFVNGQGHVADRLVLIAGTSPQQDLGGWCRAAIVDRLMDALAAETRKLRGI